MERVTRGGGAIKEGRCARSVRDEAWRTKGCLCLVLKRGSLRRDKRDEKYRSKRERATGELRGHSKREIESGLKEWKKAGRGL